MGWRNPLSNSDQPINPEFEQEARLVEQARSGSERAFAALLARYQQPVFRLIFYLVGSEVEARELAKAALKHALLHMPRVPAGYSIRPWILRVATLVALDAVRARTETPQQIIAAQLMPPADVPRMVDADPLSRGIVSTPALRPSQPLAKRSADPGMTRATSWSEIPLDLEQQLVRHLLAGLPDGDAELLALGVVGQVATRDLAALAGTSQRSIRRRIARALIMFQSQYLNVWQSVLPPGTPPPRVISSDATLLASGIHNRPATPPAASEAAISQVAQDRLEALRMQDAPSVVLRTSQPLPDVSTFAGALVRAAIEQPDAPAFGAVEFDSEDLTDALSDPAEESSVTETANYPSRETSLLLSLSPADSSISHAGTRILPRFGPPLAESSPETQQPELVSPALPNSERTVEATISAETSQATKWGESAVLAIPPTADLPQESAYVINALDLTEASDIDEPSQNTDNGNSDLGTAVDSVDEAQRVTPDQLGIEVQALAWSHTTPVHSESGLRFMDTAALAEQTETTIVMAEPPPQDPADAEVTAPPAFHVAEMPGDVDQMGESFLATLFTAEATPQPSTPSLELQPAANSATIQTVAHASDPEMTVPLRPATEGTWDTTTSPQHASWLKETPETAFEDDSTPLVPVEAPKTAIPVADNADATIVDGQPDVSQMISDATPLFPPDNADGVLKDDNHNVEDLAQEQTRDLADSPLTSEHEGLMWYEGTEATSDPQAASEWSEVAPQTNQSSDATTPGTSPEQPAFVAMDTPSGDAIAPSPTASPPDTMMEKSPVEVPAPSLTPTSQAQFPELPPQPLVRSGDTIVVSSQARSDYMARHRPSEVDASDLAGFPGVDFALAQPTSNESPLPAPPPTVTLVRGGREDRPLPADEAGRPDIQTPDMADLGGIVESVASPPPGNVAPLTNEAQPTPPKPRTPTRPMPRLRKDVDEPPGIW